MVQLLKEKIYPVTARVVYDWQFLLKLIEVREN